MLNDTTEYALRAMLCLATGEKRYQTTASLAERAAVPAPYLVKVLQQLAVAGLVYSQRGVGGGWRLTRSPEAISLLDIIRVMQRIERVPTCPLAVGRDDGTLCRLHQIQDDAARTLIEIFGSMTLAHLRLTEEPLCRREPGAARGAAKTGMRVTAGKRSRR